MDNPTHRALCGLFGQFPNGAALCVKSLRWWPKKNTKTTLAAASADSHLQIEYDAQHSRVIVGPTQIVARHLLCQMQGIDRGDEWLFKKAVPKVDEHKKTDHRSPKSPDPRRAGRLTQKSKSTSFDPAVKTPGRSRFIAILDELHLMAGGILAATGDRQNPDGAG